MIAIGVAAVYCPHPPALSGLLGCVSEGWENARTGKAGYAPACSNDGVRGVCAKPKIKCADKWHRTFLPVTVIDEHLRGQYTVGVYDRDKTIPFGERLFGAPLPVLW